MDHETHLAHRRSVDRPQWGGLFPETLFARLEAQPRVGGALAALGDALLETVDGRVLEFVALRSSAVRDCLYMWRGHARIARQRQPEPLTEAEIARIAAGPDAFTGPDASLLVAIDELLFERRLSARSERAIGAQALSLKAAVLFYETIAAIMRDAVPEAAPIRGLETPAIAARSVQETTPHADSS